MLKKTVVFLLAIFLLAMMVGCSSKEGIHTETHNVSKFQLQFQDEYVEYTDAIKGTELFEFDVADVERIEFRMPDETVVLLESEEQIKAFCGVLNAGEYTQREENDLIGGYLVDLTVNGEIIEMGWGTNFVSYEGKQYDITNQEVMEQIFDIVGIQR